MKICKLSWSISGILLIIIIAMGYKFMIVGSVTTATDGRQAITLDPSERDLLLTEMRMFLASVQRITQAATKEDMGEIVKAAREVGAAAQKAVPGTLMGKLPIAFKKLGFDTHSKFDALALDAEQMGDPQHALEQLSTLMNNCIGCHSAYQVKSTVSK